MRIMGLDIGSKFTGIAVSDEGRSLATSKESIKGYKNFEELCEKIKGEVRQYDLETIVMGDPMHMCGDKSHSFQEIKKIGDVLFRETGIPVVYWDERLSTQAVEKAMIECDLSRKKRKKKIDSAAAQWILQGYLDYCKEKEDNNCNRTQMDRD